jgi:hypothetical protein
VADLIIDSRFKTAAAAQAVGVEIGSAIDYRP